MKDKIVTLKISQLIKDYTVYPRMSIDESNIGYIIVAIKSGKVLPMPIVEDKTWRIVDGWHRIEAHRRVYGEDGKIACVVRRYESDKELFLEAGKINASHGRSMSKQDRAHFIARAQELCIDPEQIGSALSMTIEALGPLKDAYTAFGPESQTVILKKSVLGFGGKTLTQPQVDAMPKLSGMNSSFHVNQLILLIDSKMLDTANESLMARLRLLAEKLESVLGVPA